MSSKAGEMPTTDRFKDLVKIGRGTYGVVYRAVDTETRPFRPVALKVVDTSAESLPCFLVREVSMLKTLKHQNIVRLFELVHEGASFIMVFESMAMDLNEYIRRNSTGIGRDLSLSYMTQLLSALAYMHRRGFIHRDLKPANLLIDKEGNLKLADFGLSREMLFDHHHSPELVTLWYRPIELLLGGRKYTCALDMWSAGVIYMQMLTGCLPFFGNDTYDVIDAIISTMGCPRPEEWPEVEQLQNYEQLSGRQHLPSQPFSIKFPGLHPQDAFLLNSLIRFNPNTRMTARDALFFPMFDPYRDHVE